MNNENIILSKIAEIEKAMILATKTMLTIKEASLICGLSVSYLHRLTSQGKISHYKPNGKKIYFDKHELEKWLRRKKVVGVEETEKDALLSDYVNSAS